MNEKMSVLILRFMYCRIPLLVANEVFMDSIGSGISLMRPNEGGLLPQQALQKPNRDKQTAYRDKISWTSHSHLSEAPQQSWASRASKVPKTRHLLLAFPPPCSPTSQLGPFVCTTFLALSALQSPECTSSLPEMHALCTSHARFTLHLRFSHHTLYTHKLGVNIIKSPMVTK